MGGGKGGQNTGLCPAVTEHGVERVRKEEVGGVDEDLSM